MAANFAVHQTVALALCARRVRATSKPPTDFGGSGGIREEETSNSGS